MAKKKAIIGPVTSFLVVLFKSNVFLLVLTVVVCFCVCFYGGGLKKISEKFKVEQIEFDGNERVPEVLLLKSSGIRYKTNIFSVRLEEVKKKLEQISWVKSVSVQRKLPDRVYIRIAERIPIAILQSKYKLYLLDIDGKVLEHDKIGSFDNLPIVVGEGAEKGAGHLLSVLNQFPKIRRQLVFAVFVGKRRWNININKGITVKLPERNLIYAMKILDEISDENGFFSEDIQEIDLRILDRVIVKRKNSVQQ